MKHRIKSAVNYVLSLFGISVLFPGERTLQGLRPYVFEFYQRQSTGILHIGANNGSEALSYSHLDLPVIWIEADPVIFKSLENHLTKFPKQNALNVLLSDTNGPVDFFVTSNSGFSSSVHPLSQKGKEIWEIEIRESKRLNSSRLDDLVVQNLEKFNFWVVDVQGHELQVLKGAEKSLSFANWILVEVSTESFYEDQCLFDEVDSWLESKGFYSLYQPNQAHCEILYSRRVRTMKSR